MLSTGPEGKPGEFAAAGLAVQLVWEGLSPQDRLAFHEFCCENNHDLIHQLVIARIRRAVASALGE